MSGSNSLRVKASLSGPTFLGVLFFTLGGDRIQIYENIYDLFPEIIEALSSRSYTGKTMKNETDILMTNNIVRDLGYTGIRDRPSNRETFFTTRLPKLVEDIQNRTFDGTTDDSDDLQGEGGKLLFRRT